MENISFSSLEHTRDVTKEELQKLRVDLPTLKAVDLQTLEERINAYTEAKKDYLEQHGDVQTELSALRMEVMEQREEMPEPVQSSANDNDAKLPEAEKILSYEEFAGLKKPTFDRLDRLMHVMGITSLSYLVYRFRMWLKNRSTKPAEASKPLAKPEPVLKDIGAILSAPIVQAKVKEKTAVKKKAPAKPKVDKAPKKEPVKKAPAKLKKVPKKKEPVEELVIEPAPEPEIEPVRNATPVEGPMIAGDTEVTFDTKEIDGERETVFSLGGKTYRVSALTLLGEIDAGKMVSKVEREEEELCITGTLSGLTKTVYITSDEIARIGAKLEGGKKSSAAVTITYFDAPLSKKNRSQHSATLKFTSI